MLAPHRPLLTTELPALETRGLTVRYGSVVALRDVSVSIRPGLMTAIVGPNGAGKSTLLKAALGLVPASAGSATIFGSSVAEARDRFAYVPQRAAVEWDFPASALDVVCMGLYRRIGWFRPVRRRHRETARAALAAVGLADLAERPIGALSGGQQQRVFLARALAQQAELVLLDEPFAGVDAASETVLWERLAALRDEGRTVVVVHHDLDAVLRSFDEAVLLNRTLVAAGPVEEALNRETLAEAYGGALARALAA
jgi:manganese/zinc/iron transport system ATP- binding protein